MPPNTPERSTESGKMPDLEKYLAKLTSKSIKKAGAGLKPAPAVPNTTSERGILLVLPCRTANQSNCRWITIKTELSIAGSHSWTRLTQILDSEHNTCEILRHHFHRWINYHPRSDTFAPQAPFDESSASSLTRPSPWAG